MSNSMSTAYVHVRAHVHVLAHAHVA
jgi:hypothetical protein